MQSAQVLHQLPNLLNCMKSEPPDLIWVCLANRVMNSDVRAKQHIAIRLLLKEQLLHDRHIAVEAVCTTNDVSSSFFIDPSWIDDHPKLQIASVWWCALGLTKPSTSKSADPSKQSCANTSTLSSFVLPNRFLSCCGNSQSKKKGIRPKNTPANYYLNILKMLREAYVLATSPVGDSVFVEAYPTDAKERSKHKQAGIRKPAGAKTWNEDDGPGEHADNLVPLKPSKFIENCFDDCGDDITPLLEASDKAYSLFETELETLCPSDSEDDTLDAFLSDEYVFWAFPGSDSNIEAQQIEARPFSTHCSNFTEAYAILQTNPGKLDAVELFGGKGETTKLAFRRKLRTGHNFDVVCDFDLTDANQVALLWRYLIAAKPEIVICAPPCTSFGQWARFNKVHHFQTWNRNHKTGLLLANLTAEICMFQVSEGRHLCS